MRRLRNSAEAVNMAGGDHDSERWTCWRVVVAVKHDGWRNEDQSRIIQKSVRRNIQLTVRHSDMSTAPQVRGYDSAGYPGGRSVTDNSDVSDFSGGDPSDPISKMRL